MRLIDFRMMICRIRTWAGRLWHSLKVGNPANASPANPKPSHPGAHPGQTKQTKQTNGPEVAKENGAGKETGEVAKPGDLKAPPEAPGKRRRPNPPSEPRLPSKHSPASRPELICRRRHGSWEIILSADDDCHIENVRFNGKSLDFDNANGECRLPSFAESVQVAMKEGEPVEFPMLADKPDKPLIFKLRNNWTGDGRKVRGIASGYFVVIAPREWTRNGQVPLAPDACVDPQFVAHYFFRDENKSALDFGGFRECPITPAKSAYNLSGDRVFDHSKEGKLFGGCVPVLKHSESVTWVRVGEERKDGWKGENFRPGEATLAEVLNGRQGRFFVRVYDSKVQLLDSGEFRYLRDLGDIHVNDEPLTERTILATSSTGHAPTKIRFIGLGGKSNRLAIQPDVGAFRGDDFVVEPCPNLQCISCTVENKFGSVDIVLDLPFVWWRMEGCEDSAAEWRDTPIVMTRQEFREAADADAKVHLRLPLPIRPVRVGFNDELEQQFRPTRNDAQASSRLIVPLSDFAYFSQIAQRLNNNASLNVACDDATVTIVQVVADPVPAIVSFAPVPAMVAVGERATLRWTVRDAEVGSVSIEPQIGAVGSIGSREVQPLITTDYTLRLTAFDMEDVTKAVTVAVIQPLLIGARLTARVRRVGGGWTRGKGFSKAELEAAGLTEADARGLSISIDKRRGTAHQINMSALKGLNNE